MEKNKRKKERRKKEGSFSLAGLDGPMGVVVE